MTAAQGERLVLDTSAHARLRAGHGEVLDRMAAAEVVLIPVTVLGELEAGFLLGSRAAENRVALSELLARPYVRTLDVTPDVARRYAELLAALRRQGTPVPTNDVWIAAATVEARGHLLTFDGDFGRFPGLSVTVLRP